jgi:hypothetical protein
LNVSEGIEWGGKAGETAPSSKEPNVGIHRIAVASLVVALATQLLGAELPYRFGMTKEEVRAEAACTPYKDVATTGGLECANFVLDQKRNVSLVFTNGGLSKIQLWFAESASRGNALKATDELIAYMQKMQGPLESRYLPRDTEVTAAALFAALDTVRADLQAKIQVTPREQPPDAVVFASIMRIPHYGFYVFLYHVPPQK